MVDIRPGALSCRSWACLIPMFDDWFNFTSQQYFPATLCYFSLIPVLPRLHQRRRLHTKPSLHSTCLQQTLVLCCFDGPDRSAYLPYRFKIMDPIFIASDYIRKFLFIIFWKYFEQLFRCFKSLLLLIITQKLGPIWQKSS